mmetsp:Transcript_29066/g.61718  ORF Transcript_29066/g.61718 Transcript_29066/m.61718 type:complete len:515 (+) Transcript_29066:135-1679(+)
MSPVQTNEPSGSSSKCLPSIINKIPHHSNAMNVHPQLLMQKQRGSVPGNKRSRLLEFLPLRKSRGQSPRPGERGGPCSSRGSGADSSDVLFLRLSPVGSITAVHGIVTSMRMMGVVVIIGRNQGGHAAHVKYGNGIFQYLRLFVGRKGGGAVIVVNATLDSSEGRTTILGPVAMQVHEGDGGWFEVSISTVVDGVFVVIVVAVVFFGNVVHVVRMVLTLVVNRHGRRTRQSGSGIASGHLCRHSFPFRHFDVDPFVGSNGGRRRVMTMTTIVLVLVIRILASPASPSRRTALRRAVPPAIVLLRNEYPEKEGKNIRKELKHGIGLGGPKEDPARQIRRGGGGGGARAVPTMDGSGAIAGVSLVDVDAAVIASSLGEAGSSTGSSMGVRRLLREDSQFQSQGRSAFVAVGFAEVGRFHPRSGRGGTRPSPSMIVVALRRGTLFHHHHHPGAVVVADAAIAIHSHWLVVAVVEDATSVGRGEMSGGEVGIVAVVRRFVGFAAEGGRGRRVVRGSWW